MKVTGLGQEVEARQGHPSNGFESGGAAPGSLTRLPQQTGRAKTGGPEHERVLTEPAAGTTPPCWGCLRLTWTNRDL